MKISVITPFPKTHEAFIGEAYQSLLGQTFSNWEWVLVENRGGVVPDEIRLDARVVIVPGEDDSGPRNSIGRLKKLGAGVSTGDVILELDADDILTADCLKEVAVAIPGRAMVYSNSAEFKHETWESSSYSEYWGWRWRPFEYRGHNLREMIAWEPSPHMMRFVFWAPNHVRAWDRMAYFGIGGHDENVVVGDDHELCCRLYVKYGDSGFRHIDKCLYLYRIHENNSCRVWNGDVQKQTEKNYCRYSRDMATRWARDKEYLLVDLGGRFGAWDGYKTIDRFPPANIIADLDERWPMADNSVGVLRASHVFEHLKDSVHTMNEAYRVLVPGGWLFLEVPSTDGRGAFQDPTHKTFWNENSIWYYTKSEYAKYIIPGYTGRFQESRVVTYFPNEFFREHNIPIVQADLIALKPPYDERPPGGARI